MSDDEWVILRYNDHAEHRITNVLQIFYDLRLEQYRL